MDNNKENILIVEDEVALSSVLKTKLQKEGYEVDGAKDGEEGYEKIKQNKPDLILLDIVMPKMDGYRVLKKMREDNIRIPVIIISNSGQPVELEKTKKLGAVDHLIKTQFEPKEVIDKVTNYLEGKKVQNKKRAGNKREEKKQSENNKGIRVLVVEDDSFLRDLITRELSKKGFTIFEAVDGEKALDRLENINPDIILLDIILPAIDGFEVLEKIREHKSKNIKEVPVLMLSNLGEKDDIKKAKELGANDYMIKAHFTTKDITKKIKETLNID
jgi:DNA-binding response OmpR family regulator